MIDNEGVHRIRFSPDDVELFSVASHDRSPLHLSEEFARKTPYGQPVLFGVLAGLACIGHFPDRPDRNASRITMEFVKPIFAGIEYSLELADPSGDATTAKLYDGRHLALKVAGNFHDRNNGPQAAEIDAISRGPQPLVPEILTPGFETHGTYAPDWERVTAVMNRLGLMGKGIDRWQVAALMWCSYFVGMELPRGRGLFSSVSLQFERSNRVNQASLDYDARVLAFDRRFDLLRAGVTLRSNGGGLATGEVRAFVREELSPPDIGKAKTFRSVSPKLQGKVALVVGGSRGLGAAIVQLLSLQGCKVLVSHHKSKAAAVRLKESLADAPGEVSLLQGNAADISWCKEIRQRVIQEEGRLDFLICTASPALLPLWLEPHMIDRVNTHVSQSFALVSVPMAVFLDALAENAGWSVVISSTAVRKTVAEWPHYVSAKHAIEGLVKVAAQEYNSVNFLLVRPPRLLTDLTNTPLGREGALPLERVAARIVKLISRPSDEARLNNIPSLKIVSDFRRRSQLSF